MKKVTFLMVALTCCLSGYAQNLKKGNQGIKSPEKKSVSKFVNSINPAAIIFTDNMNGDNSLTGLAARGYMTYYRGAGPQGSDEWFQGDPTAFDALNGPDSGYVASDYTTVTGSNDIDNWLVLPPLAINAGDSISFYSRTFQGSTFVDSIRVMFNPTGATLPEDTNWVELGRFMVDTTLGDWMRMSYAAPDSGSAATFAIRYAVADGGPSGANSNYVGIDQIDVYDQASGSGFDECVGATSIDTAMGQAIGAVQTVGPYDNSTATVGAQDPTTGFECFGEPNGGGASPEINNTVWFTFTGDGNNYFIESANCAGITNYIDDGDTQFALYTGTCGALSPLKCNEDGPNATATTYPAGFSFGTIAGATYYLMVDGFNATALGGGISSGEFCLKVTRQATVACTDTAVKTGTQTQNFTNLCFGDTVRIATSGAVSPNTGDNFGIIWVVSTADLNGNPDSLTSASVIGSYSAVNPVPPVSTVTLVNNGSFLPPGNTYYWTPVIFGNATGNVPSPSNVGDFTFDPSCTLLGTSMAVNVLIQGDPNCAVGVMENLNGKNVSMVAYPSPAYDLLNIEFTAAERENASLFVTDFTGREVISKSIKSTSGENKITLDVKALSAGTYLVSIKNSQGNRNVKFIKY